MTEVMNSESLVFQFRQYCPDNKTDEEIRGLIDETDGDFVEIHRKIGKWWEDMAGTVSPVQSPKTIKNSEQHLPFNEHNRKSTTPNKRSKRQEKFMAGLSSPQSPKIIDVSAENVIEADFPTPLNESNFKFSLLQMKAGKQFEDEGNEPAFDSGSENGKMYGAVTENIHATKLPSQRNTMEQFEQSTEKKNSTMYSLNDDNTPLNSQLNSQISYMTQENKVKQHRSRELSSREFASREYPSTSSTNVKSRDQTSHGTNFRSREQASGDFSKSSRRQSRDEKNREKSRSERKHAHSSSKHRRRDKDRKSTSRSNSRAMSQVNLLAQHCFTLSDEAISSLVKYKVTAQPQAGTTDKLQKRDELIKHLQEALFVLSQEKQRFQTACADIEMCLYEENQELRAQTSAGTEDTVDPKELQQVKEETLSLKAKLTAKEEEVNKINQAKNERENRISALSTEIMKIQLDRKEDDESKIHHKEKILALNAEASKLKQSISQKNEELRLIIKNFGELQKKNQEKESKFNLKHGTTEKKMRALEQQRNDLQQQLSSQSTDNAILFSEISTLKETIQYVQDKLKEKRNLEKDSSSQTQQLREAFMIERELRARAELKEEEQRKERIVACAQLLAIEAAQGDDVERVFSEKIGNIAEWEAKVNQTEQEKTELSEKNQHIHARHAQLEGEILGLQSQLEEALDDTAQMEEIGKLNNEIQYKKKELSEIENKKKLNRENFDERIRSLEHSIEEKKVKLQEVDFECRQLLTRIQELRGNVRVFARVRPFLPGEGDEHEVDADGNPLHSYANAMSTVETKMDKTSIILRKKNEFDESVEEEMKFNFDKVFAPSVGQEQVYKEMSEYVQAALEGYNICIFSYGQNGSGKTHTIQGSGTGPMRGIFPRAIEQMVEHQNNVKSQGWECELQVSYIQIYNEEIIDLLCDQLEFQNVSEGGKELVIRQDKKGRPYIEGLTKMRIDPLNQDLIENFMSIAARHRNSMRSNPDMNPSFSHTIFTFYLTLCNPKQGYAVEGQLNLCDLGSSEIPNSDSKSLDDLNQFPLLNKSLSTLLEAFAAVADHRSNIPFKNSKLTHFLMPALSGEGKTMVIINISPSQSNFSQSLSTLKFGVMANQCELGKPTKNVKDTAISDKSKDQSSLTPTNQNTNTKINDKSPTTASGRSSSSARGLSKGATRK